MEPALFSELMKTSLSVDTCLKIIYAIHVSSGPRVLTGLIFFFAMDDTFQEQAAGQVNQKVVIQIPRTAVADKNGKHSVFVFEGEQPREREVQRGRIEGEYVTIEKGLADGEKIVVEGIQYITLN
jgi:hypothetical protein